MQRISSLFFGPSDRGGRGIFTDALIPKDSLIEICPVIVCPPPDLKKIHETKLHDYYFLWGDKEDHCAIALGYGSLYNHSNTPNARYWVDEEAEQMEIWSIKAIAKGEEVFVSYYGDPSEPRPLWFDVD